MQICFNWVLKMDCNCGARGGPHVVFWRQFATSIHDFFHFQPIKIGEFSEPFSWFGWKKLPWNNRERNVSSTPKVSTADPKVSTTDPKVREKNVMKTWKVPPPQTAVVLEGSNISNIVSKQWTTSWPWWKPGRRFEIRCTRLMLRIGL